MHGTRIYVNFMLRSTIHDFLDSNKNNLRYIYGSHSGEYSDNGLLKCDTV
jgi:hypothetical protein